MFLTLAKITAGLRIRIKEESRTTTKPVRRPAPDQLKLQYDLTAPGIGLVCFVVPLSPTYRSIPGVTYLFSWYTGACSRKSGGNTESMRGGRTVPYAIRESWLSMNTIPFRTVSEWNSTLIRIYACSSASHAHVSHTYAGPHSYTHTYNTFIGHTNRHLYRHIRERNSYSRTTDFD